MRRTASEKMEIIRLVEDTDPNGGKTRQGFELAMDLISGSPPASPDAN